MEVNTFRSIPGRRNSGAKVSRRETIVFKDLKENQVAGPQYVRMVWEAGAVVGARSYKE